MTTLDSHLFDEDYIKLRQNASRSHAAQIVFGIFIAIEVLSLLFYYLQYTLVSKAQSGGYITMGDINTNDTLVMLVEIAELIIFILAIIIFIRWFRRAYYNVHQLGLSNLTRSEGWAAGAWFVPIINLYLPYQIMRDIWVGMQRFLKEEKEGYVTQGAAIIGVWWFFFIARNISSNITSRLAWKADSVDKLMALTQFSLITNVLNIIGLVLIILITRKAADMELDLRKTIRAMEERKDDEQLLVSDGKSL